MAVDKIAREMGSAALFAWGNLVGALVDTLREADVPTNLIHGVLDKLDEANGRVLQGDGRQAYLALVAAIRDGLPSND